MKNNDRVIGLDIIRCLAFVLVVSVHSILYLGYNNTPMVGTEHIIVVFLRGIFMSCVPLFLLLTGYLNGNKKIEKRYYLKLAELFVLYVMSCCFNYFFLKFIGGETIQFSNLFNYTMTFGDEGGYAWYFEMYIGLFLFIPFLNILYSNLNDKQKQQLLFTLLLVGSLPFTINKLFGDLYFLPDWWSKLYIILYYYIGMYIHDKVKGVNKKKISLLLACSVLLFGVIKLITDYGQIPTPENINQYSSLLIITISVCIFLLLKDVRLNNQSKMMRFIKRLINKLSPLTFIGFLISFSFDRFIYQLLFDKIYIGVKLCWMPVAICLIVVLSFLVAGIINWVYRLCKGTFIETFKKISNKRQL